MVPWYNYAFLNSSGRLTSAFNPTASSITQHLEHSGHQRPVLLMMRYDKQGFELINPDTQWPEDQLVAVLTKKHTQVDQSHDIIRVFSVRLLHPQMQPGAHTPSKPGRPYVLDPWV